MAEIKISELTANGANLQTTDRIPTAVDDGMGGFVTRYVTGDEVIGAVSKTTVPVRNQSGATIYKGTIVYISSAAGNKLLISKSLANSEATSARTLGVVTANIPNNSNGNVQTSGILTNLDTRSSATHPFTSVTLAEGDTLYLDPTTAGYITNIKPSAPNHLVYIGKVINASPTTGEILYQIQNGYELDEIHDVAIASVANNDVLQYDSATSLWKNRAISSGLTVGTTAITSGTIGRILFEGTGNVLQEDAKLFWDNTNKKLGIGATPDTSTVLDVRSAGTLATDLAFRVRNSANTLNTFEVRGDGNAIFSGDTTSTKFLFGDAFLLSGGANVARYGGTALIKHRFTNNGTTAYFEIDPANSIIYSDSSMKMSIGASTAGAKLDVRAQGALSTDLAFRVRNSANTTDILKVQGDAGIVHNGRFGLNTATNSGIDLFITAGSASSYGIFAIGTYGVAAISARPDTATTNYNFHAPVCARFGAYYASNTGGGTTVTGIRIGYVAESFNANAFDNIGFKCDIANTGGGGAIALDIVNGNFRFGTATGTKIATATTQKIGFWNATPIVQPTTAVAASTFVANTSLIANDTATFDGYTIGQIVKALRNTGILA